MIPTRSAGVAGELSVPDSKGNVFEAACGLVELGSSRCDFKRGQLEKPVSFFVSDSEGMVFDAPFGCFEGIRRLLRELL